jgi:ubiquinone/menaquinone biosynthesis C-methylase UbiE
MAPPETEQLSRMLAGAALSRAICTIGELGVADHIQSGVPQPIENLARLTGSHEPSLYRMLRFTASYGVFHETTHRRFDQTPLSSALRTDAEGSFRAATQMFHRIFAGWEGLHHAVKTGEPSFQKVYGKPLFDYIGEHPELAPIFDAGMTAFHGHETAAMLDAYDFSGIETLADIGGGNGSLLGAVLQRYPRMKGILYDLGHVSGRARDALKALGLENRCSVVEGNFFESVPRGADAYLMRHVIHDWTDEQSVQILSNCRKVIPPHGKVLLVEFSVPGANQASLGKDADMIMLAFPGGCERTEEEYRALFERSGFRLAKVTPTKSAVCVIEGRPVGGA